MKDKIQAIAPSTKGIKINNEWYDGTDVWEYCQNLQKGDTVEYSTDGKRLKFIKQVKEKEEKSGLGLGKEEDRIIRMNTLRSAIEIWKMRTSIEGVPPEVDDIFNLAKKLEKYIREG